MEKKNYDGPAFFRQQELFKDDAFTSVSHEKKPVTKQPFNTTYVPPVLKKAISPQVNYGRIERQLYKQPSDYYVVVDAATDTNKLKSEADTSQPKKERIKSKNIALGHGLDDILKSETQAQRHLSVFDDHQ